MDVRVVVLRFLILWFFLLRYWASKWVRPMAASMTPELSSRRKFLSKNLELQEELRQTFSPVSHLCGKGCSCCDPKDIPYGAVDGVLYGISADLVGTKCPLAATEFITAIFWEHVFLMRRYLKKIYSRKTVYSAGVAKPQPQGSFCPALSETGCTIRWGRRPTFCVFYLCGEFLRAMEWREFWRYVWVSGRYLLFLTLSLKLVVAEWRQQQGRLCLIRRSNFDTLPSGYVPVGEIKIQL